MGEQRDLERLLKVKYANMNGLDKETQILFKQLEWGINLDTNTTVSYTHLTLPTNREV